MGTPIEAFTVFACHEGQVFQHTGANLPHQFDKTSRALDLVWPQTKRRSLFKAHAVWGAWVLPDAQLTSFEWPCSASWSPSDIEAECRLEASARMQTSPAELALDYVVQRSPEGQLSVRVWHCPQVQVNGLVLQAKELGLTLQVITVHSHMATLANFFGIPQEALPC